MRMPRPSSALADGRTKLLASIAPGDDADTSGIGERLEALAPLIDVDLDTSCAECGHAALCAFSISSPSCCSGLLDEREAVLGEVHALASGYGWSLPDILSLPRGLRRSLVRRACKASPTGFG